MAEVGARPRWRDALAVSLLAAVILAGLVHYGRGLEDDHRSSGPGPASPSSTSSPSGEPTAQLEGAPPTDPAAPAEPGGGTCWDGRETSSIALCGLPAGARGLGWVFSSFARDRELCHPALPNRDSYPVVESYACFQHALGQPVTVTYDLVEDPAQVDRWLEARIGSAHRRVLPGAHGGRYLYRDGANRPVRITGLYARFPYVVSVYADTPRAASNAWRTIVRQRPPQNVRGVRG